MYAAVFLGWLGLSLGAWFSALRRRCAGRPLVEYEPRRPVPWGLVDLLLLMPLLGPKLAGFVAPLFGSEPAVPPPLTPQLILGNVVIGLLLVVVSVTFVAVRIPVTPASFGLSVRKFGADVWLGTVTFVMLGPPVLLLQFVLTRWFPTHHPFDTLLRDDPSWTNFAACGLAAVVSAPIVEEYLFRGLLQGALEKAACRLPRSQRWFGDSNATQSVSVPEPSGDSMHGPAKWPVFASAGCFALMHATHGPDPVPLFLLALGLGYVYRQTHRLVPSLTVHCLLNGFSMTVLLIDTWGGE